MVSFPIMKLDVTKMIAVPKPKINVPKMGTILTSELRLDRLVIPMRLLLGRPAIHQKSNW